MDFIVETIPIGPTGLLACMAFWALLYHVGKVVSATVVPKIYAGLSPDLKAEWDNYVMAWVHSAVSAVLAYVCVADTLPGIPEDAWWSSTPMQRFAVQFTLAYVAVDSVFLFLKWDAIGSASMVFHHLIFPLSYGVGLYALEPAFGMFCMLVLQLCEVSTPFLHFRWFLSASGYRHTKLYTINALTFSAIFLIVRGGLMTLMLYRLFSPLPNPVYWEGCVGCTIAINCAWAFQILQYVWCVRVVRGFLAVVFGKGRKDKVDLVGEQVTERLKEA